MIGKAVDHDLAALDARGSESAGRAPRILDPVLGLVNAAGRSEQAQEGACRRRGKGAERRRVALHLRQGGLAQDRNEGEVGRRAQRGDVEVAELAGERGALSVQLAEPVAQSFKAGGVDHRVTSHASQRLRRLYVFTS